VRNSADGNGFVSGAGGSGVVIVRYLTADASGFTITGGTTSTSGSYTIHTFNSSSSLVIA
jgi:3-oxoacyl-(acyl-carrier-protein) synthase